MLAKPSAMTDRRFSQTAIRLAATALIAGAAGLSGCAAIGDSAISQAFVDPARYDLYDCKQLEVERSSIGAELARLERLMRKAETGVGGAVVAEVAYRNDYLNVQARGRLVEQTWRDRRCGESGAPPAR